MAFLVVISSPAKIRMLLPSTTHSASRPFTQSRVSHARIPFFVSVREAKLVLTEKSQVIRLSRLAWGRRDVGEEGTRNWWRVSRASKESKKFAILAWRMESNENVIYFGAAVARSEVYSDRILLFVLVWALREPNFPSPSLFPAVPVGGVLSRKDNTEKLHRAQTRVESDTLEN